MEVPCGRCYACLSNKRNAWTYRLEYESKCSVSNYFITLTYNDEHVNGGNLSKRDIQLFNKRLRKIMSPIKYRYFILGEYGGNTYRPHYHMLIFFRDVVGKEIIQLFLNQAWRDKDKKPMGHTMVGTVETASIHYCTKFHITKGCTPSGLEPSFTLMSKNPAIGKDYIYNKYLLKYHQECIEHAFVTNPNGIKQTMPRYYKDKIYTHEQKEQISLTYKDKSLEDREKWEKEHPNKSYDRYRKQFIEMCEKKKRKILKNDKL